MRDLELKVKRVSVEITWMEFYALGVHACLIWCNKCTNLSMYAGAVAKSLMCVIKRFWERDCKRNAEGILFKRVVFKEQALSKGDSTEGSRVWTVFVQSSLPFKKKTSKELIPEVHSLSLLRKGANFRGYKEVVVELWRREDRGFTNRAGSRERREVVDWKASEWNTWRVRKGWKKGTHRGRTLARGAATCFAFFLPFLQEALRETE